MFHRLHLLRRVVHDHRDSNDIELLRKRANRCHRMQETLMYGELDAHVPLFITGGSSHDNCNVIRSLGVCRMAERLLF